MTAGGVPVRTTFRVWRLALYAVFCLPVFSCGGSNDNSLTGSGGSGTTTTPPAAANVVAVTVDSGPSELQYADVNTLFTTITVCVPGSTTECQTIDHIQVDTGSYGLRILSSALTISLPVQQASNENSLAECTVFVDGYYSWGPVALADLQIAGETASSLPVQVIGSPNFSNVPADCSGTGMPQDTVATFGANGILGIGVFAHDCSDCDSTVDNGVYFACSSTECQPTAVPVANQVPNPVTFFATDNKGVIIQLPSVAAAGASTVSGSLIFGIDTQSNNASGSQTVVTVDPLAGEFTTQFNGQSYDASFLDTGSNGYFFNDGSIPQCTDSNFSDFYCPASTLDLDATLLGLNSASAAVTFSIADAETLGADAGSSVAFSNLGGPFPGMTASFDWGLPFYYGRTVYTAIEGKTTSAGTGPYVAF